MKNAELLNSIADIELPAPPNWQPGILATIIIFLLLILLLLVLRQRSNPNQKNPRNHHPATALEQLDQIEQRWKNKTINNRSTAYQLATLLRLGLKLDQLQADACPAILTAHQNVWHDTVTQLNMSRYQEHQKNELDSRIFAHIQDWLSLAKQPDEQIDEQASI